jgi:uncharacterized protein involved in exopolysaccharide biosynthesis
VVLDLPTARLDVSALDALTNVRSDYADVQTQLAAQTNLTADANKQLTDAQAVIASQSATIKDETVSCNAQLKAASAKLRKRTLKAFFIGFGTGFVAGVTAHLW